MSAPSDVPAPPNGKILTRAELLLRRAHARREGRAVVQCHGCFDIVHPGHVRHLQEARRQGDVLLVSITADALLNKGDGRPLFPQELRAENLAAFDCVDWVYINPDATAVELLREVEPDVYMKGREYETNADPRFAAERRAVEDAGGRIVFSSGDMVFSSTALVAALERDHDPFHARLTRLFAHDELAADRLELTVGLFPGRRVAVVGETIADTYVLCDRPDVASEGPIMSLRPLESVSFDGGAAVVARHLAAMGAKPTLVTPLPRSTAAEALAERLGRAGVELRTLEVPGPIPEKQRFLVGQQKVMKLDLHRPAALDAQRRRDLIGLAAGAADDADAMILADFGLGVFPPRLLAELSEAVRPRVEVLAGDVSGPRNALRKLRRLDVACPTEHELRSAMADFDDSLNAVVHRYMTETGASAPIVTLGADGLVAFEPSAGAPERGAWASRLRAEHIPALASSAVDPLGCGDALLSAATLARLVGATPVAAAFLGAIAAATHATRLGNDPVSAADLRAGVARLATSRLAIAPARVGAAVAV